MKNGRQRAIAGVVAATFVCSYEGQLAPIASLLLSDVGMSAMTYGIVTAAAILAGALAGLLGGRLTDRYGRVRLLVPFLALSGLSCFAMATVTTTAQFIAVRTLLAVVDGIAASATAPLISDVMPTTGRARAYAFWSAGPVGANMAAAAVAALTLSAFGYAWQSQLVLMGMVGLVGALAVARYLRGAALPSGSGRHNRPVAHDAPPRPSPRIRSAGWHIGVQVLAMSLIYLIFATFNAYGPLLLQTELGIRPRQASALSAVFWAANLLGSLLIAWRSDRTQRRRRYLVGAGACAGVASAVLALAIGADEPHRRVAMASLVALGFAVGAVGGPWLASLSERADTNYPHRLGTIFGTHHLASRCAVLAAVLIAPRVAAGTDWAAWIAVLAATSAVFTVLIGLLPDPAAHCWPGMAATGSRSN